MTDQVKHHKTLNGRKKRQRQIKRGGRRRVHVKEGIFPGLKRQEAVVNRSALSFGYVFSRVIHQMKIDALREQAKKKPAAEVRHEGEPDQQPAISRGLPPIVFDVCAPLSHGLSVTFKIRN